MTPARTNELLATLYLRLNGYFTTSLIIHSAKKGDNAAEIDCLAVRMPYHEQNDRTVESADFLDLQENTIDLIICEVKSNPKEAVFNPSLKNNIENIRKLLEWTGVLPKDSVEIAAKQVLSLLQDDIAKDVAINGWLERGVRIRGLICCPCFDISDDKKWCLSISEIFDYFDKCFHEREPRPDCSVTYSPRNWSEYEKLPLQNPQVAAAATI